MKRSGFRKYSYSESLDRLKGKSRYGLKSRKRLKAKPDRALAKWSRLVRERDDFTCQMTGVRDVQRNIAHHVAPRSLRPDLRLSVENGITLTPEAHQKVHDNPTWARENGWLSDETYEWANNLANKIAQDDPDGWAKAGEILKQAERKGLF